MIIPEVCKQIQYKDRIVTGSEIEKFHRYLSFKYDSFIIFVNIGVVSTIIHWYIHPGHIGMVVIKNTQDLELEKMKVQKYFNDIHEITKIKFINNEELKSNYGSVV